MDKESKFTLFVLVAIVIVSAFFIFFKFQFKSSQNDSASPALSSTPGNSSAPKEFTFAFAGDAMFGRAIYAKYRLDLKEAFQNFPTDVFQKDLAILNLEGPLVQYEFIPDTNPENLVMKFPPQVKDVLSFLGIKAVSLANNHTANQGAAALQFTRETLVGARITKVGDPQNATDIVKTFETNKRKVAIIAVNILANTPALEDLIKEQKNQGAFVVVLPHWGNEYQTTHSNEQEALAHSWIDAGADLVIGTHPHVIQDGELYNKRPIFYSLGNFIFDQTFSKNTQEGLIITGKIANDKLSLTLTPAACNFHPQLLEGQNKWTIINNLKKDLGLEASSENSGDETIEFSLK